jgi:hypothetical protein
VRVERFARDFFVRVLRLAVLRLVVFRFVVFRFDGFRFFEGSLAAATAIGAADRADVNATSKGAAAVVPTTASVWLGGA